MKNYIYILLLFFTGCKLFNPIMAQSENLNHSDDKSFEIFWIEFREAVIKNDTAKLITLTHFPLRVHGDLDEDSVIYKVRIFYFRNVLKMGAGQNFSILRNSLR
jgi:hypothetical protein